MEGLIDAAELLIYVSISALLCAAGFAAVMWGLSEYQSALPACGVW